MRLYLNLGRRDGAKEPEIEALLQRKGRRSDVAAAAQLAHLPHRARGARRHRDAPRSAAASSASATCCASAPANSAAAGLRHRVEGRAHRGADAPRARRGLSRHRHRQSAQALLRSRRRRRRSQPRSPTASSRATSCSCRPSSPTSAGRIIACRTTRRRRSRAGARSRSRRRSSICTPTTSTRTCCTGRRSAMGSATTTGEIWRRDGGDSHATARRACSASATCRSRSSPSCGAEAR